MPVVTRRGSFLLSVLLVGCSAASLSSSPSPSSESSSPSASSPSAPSPSGPPELPTTDAPLAPGTYHVSASGWSVVDYTLTFPAGWLEYGQTFMKHPDYPVPKLHFYPVVVDKIFNDACATYTNQVAVGPTVRNLADALTAQPGPNASEPVETTLGGFPALRVDLTIPEGLDLQACRMGADGGLQIWYSQFVDKYFVLLYDGTASVYIVDVNGQRQVFLTQYRAGTTAADVEEMQAILDSIQISPPQ